MYAAAPRVERALLESAVALDDGSVPVAETYRLLRDVAEQLGVPRPSYERIRTHLRVARQLEVEQRLVRERVRELLLQLALNTRPADSVVRELLAIVDERERRPCCNL